MSRLNNSIEKRRYPRFLIDLPLEYRVIDISHAHGALVVNASEAGLLIKSVENIPISTNLDILVLFRKEFELVNFEVLAEVVWNKTHSKEGWTGYQCGLNFISIREHDRWKLRQLLRGRFNLDGISYNL